jgi:elongation factor Ts
MASYELKDIQELRERTGMGMMDVKKALDASNGDKAKALEALKERGAQIMAKKADRHAAEGLIESYVHNGRIGVLVEVNCETDFVARNDAFESFAHDVALQIASMNPANVEELLAQDFFKASSQTIGEYLTEVTGKLGEKIVISRFTRFQLGELAGEKPAAD